MPAELSLATLFLIFCAVSVLAFVRHRHLFLPAFIPPSAIRLSVWMVLAFSLWLSGMEYGWEQGVTLWLCVASLAGIISSYSLSRYERFHHRMLLTAFFGLALSGLFKIL